MKATIALSLALLLACAVVNAQAPKKATLQKSKQNDLLVIHTQKGFSTLIEFPLDQKILEVTCGDKEFWVVEASGRFLHIKPAKEGIVTNLNVLIEGDVIYTFLLKEISKTPSVKDGPDLRVTVNGGDDLTKLRNDKDKLEEALAKSERAVKDLNEKVDAEKQRGTKKNDPWQPGKDEETDESSGAPDTKPLAETATGTADGATLTGTPAATSASAGVAPVSAEQAPIASTYVIQRKGGLMRSSGHLLKRLVHRVNRVLHIY